MIIILRPPDGADVKEGSVNLFDAMSSHLAWKARLHEYVEGNTSEYLDTDEVVLDGSCELGRWIQAHHADMQGLPEFVKVHEVHADFHRCLAEVARLANRGDIPGARAALHGEFAHVAALLVKSITRLNKATGDKSPAAA
jgi:hypothetical protein